MVKRVTNRGRSKENRNLATVSFYVYNTTLSFPSDVYVLIIDECDVLPMHRKRT